MPHRCDSAPDPKLVYHLQQQADALPLSVFGCISAAGPQHQLAGDGISIGLQVRDLFGEDMPDYHQRLACNRDDGLLLANALCQPLKLGGPVGWVSTAT